MPLFQKDDVALTAPMLIGQISRMHSCRMREEDPGDTIMSQNSCRVLLMMLAHREGVTQLDLARAARLKPPTVSVALKRMEAEGYIRREADEDDLRAVRVYLTDKGRALDRANIERLKHMERLMMDGFTGEESRELCEMLIRIRNNLSEGQCTVK